MDGVVVPGFANATFSTAQFENNTRSNITAVGGLDPGRAHSIRVFKSTECQFAASSPSPNFLTLFAVRLVGASSSRLRAQPAMLHQPTNPTARKLEFIGDSMMAGYCNLLWAPDINRHKTNRSNLESFWLSWPTRTCETLGAECHTAA